MKRALAYLFAAFILIGTSQAQDDRSARFGLKFAPNMSWLKPDVKDVKKSGNVLGYTFGLMGDFRIGSASTYAFSTGIFLNNVGGKFTYPFSYATDTVGTISTKELENDYRLRYIELPITMKLKTNEIGYMTYYGQIGVGLAFNIRAVGDLQLLDANGRITTLVDEDIADGVNFLKTDLILGAGMEYNFSGNTSALVGVTYHGGFSNIIDGGEINGEKAKLLASYFELTLGVFF